MARPPRASSGPLSLAFIPVDDVVLCHGQELGLSKSAVLVLATVFTALTVANAKTASPKIQC